MIQEDLNFDEPIEDEVQDTDGPHCRVCGDALILGVNYLESTQKYGQRICRTCKNKIREEEKKRCYKINSDPNKVWDPEYLKTCSICKKTQKAEEHHHKALRAKDGYQHACSVCTNKKRQTPKIKHYHMKRDAKLRNYEWTLEIKDISGLLLSDCYYCGKPSQEGIKIHGLDRVENDRGYHLDNVVPCCYDCNIAKATQTQEDFIEMCKRVADRHTTYEKSNVEWIKVYLEDSGVGEIIKENFIDPIW